MGGMSETSNVVGEVRKVIQDLVAPELRSVKTEVQNMRQDLHQMEGRIMRYVDTRIEEIREIVKLRERLVAVETRLETKATEKPS